MSIISVAAAVSMRRTHEAFEKRLKEAKDREYRRREEERRRNEENKRRREEERRRNEENKRRHERREKEALYTKHSRETIDEVSAFETVTTFSAKCLHSKDEVFDKIVSYDGYAYRCADGSSITKDVDSQYYVKKLSNGVTQTYKELGARDGVKAEVIYLLSREDLPDGRARVYDTKCRGSSSSGRYRSYTDKENNYFISYECDADGSYRRYDVTEEKEDESYANYRSDIPYKTMLIDDVKAETKMSTLSKENTELKDVSLELEKMKKKVKNRQLSGVAVADKIAEDIISGREKRIITYEVGQELSDKYKREYALSRKQNGGK